MADVQMLGSGMQLVMSLVGFIVLLPISALILWVSGRIFKVGIPYVKALIPAAIIGVVGILISLPSVMMQNIAVSMGTGIINFLVGLALYLVLPKYIFNLEWKTGLLVGLVWFVLMIVVGLIVGMILGIIFLAVTLSGLA